MKKLLILIVVVLILKLIYLLFAYFIGIQPDFNVFKRNDSYWYETISTNGHSKITPDQLGSCEEDKLEQSYYAFFPAYPAIIGSMMVVTGLSFNIIAFVFSCVFSSILVLTFYKFLLKYSGSENVAFISSILLFIFPFHYYFSVYYTEAMFLLFLIAAFISIDSNKMISFSVFSAILVLVRPNGLFMLVPLWLYYLEKNNIQNIKGAFEFIKSYSSHIIYFSVPVLVFVGYCFYLKIMTGDFFAYKTAQAGWCRETVPPWVPILRSNNWIDYFNSVYLILFMFISIIYYKRLPFSFSVLIWISLLLPLTANSITSPRFISVVFVFTYLFGILLSKINKTAQVIVYIILLILHLYTFKFWLLESRFSF